MFRKLVLCRLKLLRVDESNRRVVRCGEGVLSCDVSYRIPLYLFVTHGEIHHNPIKGQRGVFRARPAEKTGFLVIEWGSRTAKCFVRYGSRAPIHQQPNV